MRCVYVSALVRGCVRACVCDDAPLRGGGVEGHPPWELSRARPRCTLPCGGILQTLLKYGNFLCPAPCSPKPVPGEPEGGSGRAQPRAAAVVPVAPGPESGVGAPGPLHTFQWGGLLCARPHPTQATRLPGDLRPCRNLAGAAGRPPAQAPGPRPPPAGPVASRPKDPCESAGGCSPTSSVQVAAPVHPSGRRARTRRVTARCPVPRGLPCRQGRSSSATSQEPAPPWQPPPPGAAGDSAHVGGIGKAKRVAEKIRHQPRTSWPRLQRRGLAVRAVRCAVTGQDQATPRQARRAADRRWGSAHPTSGTPCDYISGDSTPACTVLISSGALVRKQGANQARRMRDEHPPPALACSAQVRGALRPAPASPSRRPRPSAAFGTLMIKSSQWSPSGDGAVPAQRWAISHRRTLNYL